jgi:5-methylcytosine-specific restriction endonuclease McrA
MSLVRYDGPQQKAPLRKLGVTARARKARRAKRQREARSVYALVDERDQLSCRCCGRFCGQVREQHHIVYRSHGGTETTGNLVTLCAADHRAVHDAHVRISGNADGELTFERL